MDTASLKNFAQNARRNLMDQVSNKLKAVLAHDSLARRESVAAVAHLESLIKEHSQEYVIERVAYIWFNRFSALRFMDVNYYNPVGIVSPAKGQSQPEILADAKSGHVDSELVPTSIRQKVNDLIANKIPSENPQAEAYRLLLVAACNYWNQAMPFLFERIADYSELLIPDDLLSDQSVLAQLRSSMTPEDCSDIEIIGWLYQFYISERKENIDLKVKRGGKVQIDEISPKTALFTPHWIVQYLIENSLGRLWLLNNPNSNLANEMAYYVKPEEQEEDYLKIVSPEDIKVCDPACGSGHMLVYAFDLLYNIYEEEGYDPIDIPAIIITKNLYGIEIDERAGELAAFALAMKARSKQPRFFNQCIRPNICVLKNLGFEQAELKEYFDFVGRDLFTIQLQNTLQQFEESENLGSLIRPELTNVESMVRFLADKDVGSDLFHNKTHLKVMECLKQAQYLCSKYHVVIANPPYLGGNGMNESLTEFAKANYSDSKSDLFSMFIERNFDLVYKHGIVAMITMQNWMFLSSFEKLRSNIIGEHTILTLAHLGPHAFDSIGGEVVSTAMFTIKKQKDIGFKGVYLRIIEGDSERIKNEMLLNAIRNPDCAYLYRVTSEEFEKVPGGPIAYWISETLRYAFLKCKLFRDVANIKAGLSTANNPKYMRIWSEVGLGSIGFNYSDIEKTKNGNHKWFPCNSGGNYKKWSFEKEYIIDWENNGQRLKQQKGAALRNQDYYFKEGITWNKLSSSNYSAKYKDFGYIFDDTSRSAFSSQNTPISILYALGLLNSNIANLFLQALNPTMSFTNYDIERIPIIQSQNNENIEKAVFECIEIAKADINNFESSWDFQRSPIMSVNCNSIESCYRAIRSKWQSDTTRMQQLEAENNLTLLEAYGAKDELKSELPVSEITLNCNPYYRYGSNKNENELELLLLADTIREFISFSVGCMFGRYSIDKPGLILANQGETVAEYHRQIPSPTFMPDVDNVIPILDGDWFVDDIVERFRQFLRTTFGDEHFQENLQFIEESIGKDIRSFFLKDFYNDHIKRYKKRPIYWMFSSPKGTFNALIYIHRYRPDTVSIILNKYLREFKVKLSARIEYLNRIEVSANVSKAEKTHALKERETIKKNLEELDTWERDVIYPLALEQKEINLDDGVKSNYPKFGSALKRISGLDVEED